MTRLLALFSGNPLIFIGSVLAIFVFGAASGGSVAWWAQGIRITSCEQDHTTYVQEQTTKFQEATHAADIERSKTSAAYERASSDLANSIENHDVYVRCVAAGKCGARVQRQSTCAAGIRLPAALGVIDTGTDAVPLGPGATAEDPVVGDCAKTTLMLNSLQADIERQPGYSQ